MDIGNSVAQKIYSDAYTGIYRPCWDAVYEKRLVASGIVAIVHKRTWTDIHDTVIIPYSITSDSKWIWN